MADRAGHDLIEQAAMAVLDAWNEVWNQDPNFVGQAGESWRRRFYVEKVIDFLRELPVDQRMEAMGMEQVTMPGGGGWWLTDDNGLVRGGPGAPSLRPVYVERVP